MTRTSQERVNVKCPPNVFLSMLKRGLSVAFSHLRCPARLLKYILWFLGLLYHWFFFSGWKFPCPDLRWHQPWAGIRPWAQRNLVRATVTLTLWQRICEADSSVLGLGLKPPDSLHNLLYHMVAVLGTVGLKLNLWHEVKIKKKINPSVLHYHIPEASGLCSCLCLYSTERI